MKYVLFRIVSLRSPEGCIDYLAPAIGINDILRPQDMFIWCRGLENNMENLKNRQDMLFAIEDKIARIIGCIRSEFLFIDCDDHPEYAMLSHDGCITHVYTCIDRLS